MELLLGRNCARTSRGPVELLLISLTVFQLSTAQAIIFHYGENLTAGGYPQLEVRDQPNATITELQDDSITCLGDFVPNGTSWQNEAEGHDLVLTVGSHQEADLKGRCLYRNPIHLMNASFSTRFSVAVISSYQPQECPGVNLSGTLQGLAFIMASDNSTQGDGRGYLGWLNSTTNTQPGHNFAVELDFWQDVQFQDPLGTHVGVDQNSLTSVDTFILESLRGRNLTAWGLEPYLTPKLSMWIDYNSSAQMLEIYVSQQDYLVKPKSPTLSKSIDLSKVLSQEGMFVGFSGSISNVTSTGQGEGRSSYSLGYTIYDWTFNSDGVAPDYPRFSPRFSDDGYVLFPSEGPTDHQEHQAKIRAERIIIISVTIPSCVLSLILALVICKLYTKNARLAALAKKYEIDDGMLEGGAQSFKYTVLSTATKGFSSDQFLGSGGFGSVYKGRLSRKGADKPTDIAVKRISAASHQGAREFLAEVKVIGQVQHRNLVRLLGWCHERGELLLVYDYMPNGSLDQHLFNPSEEQPVLTWARRLKIVSGVATALSYLHEEWEKRVIHRDVKSSNVMLDRDFNARLGDFGLARLSDHDQAPPSTAVLAGTYGYLAPELTYTLKSTEKTDVYSFGALVLEVATGKRPILSLEDQKTTNEVLLVDWVWGLHRDNSLLDAADVGLRGSYDSGEMILFLKIGLLCSHPDPAERPTMREVLNIWKGSTPVPQLPRTKPVPIFISNRDGFGLDTTVTIPMNVFGYSDTSGDQTVILNSQGSTKTNIYSKPDGDSCPAETPLERKVVTPSSSLRYRPSKTTTSLPF